MSLREYPTYEEQRKYYDREWGSWLNGKLGSGKLRLGEDEFCRGQFIVQNVKKRAYRSRHKLKIIDLGCGPGWIANSLSKYGDVVGVDNERARRSSTTGLVDSSIGKANDDDWRLRNS